MQVLDLGFSISTECFIVLFLAEKMHHISTWLKPDVVKKSVHIQTSKGYEVGFRSISCK